MSDEIELAPISRELFHEYYRGFCNDPDIFMEMSLFKEFVYDHDKVDARFTKLVNTPDRRDFLILRGGAPVGEVSLKRIDTDKMECELSVHLQSDAVKNMGIGTRAEKLALRHAFDVLGMNAVNADAVQKNARSQHVMEKVGFKFVREDDMFRYYRFEREASAL